MQRFTNWLVWAVVLATGALAALNWSTLMTPAPIDLLVARIDAPLGLVMLTLTAMLCGLFLVATLRNQIGALLENRRLLKEIQRVQSVADQAEASRMQSLQQLIETGFRRIDDRLSGLQPSAAAPARQPSPTSL